MSQREDIVRWAQAQIGKPYSAYRDCSGFTAAAFRQAGITIPEGSVAQWQQGAPIDDDDVLPGDLLFWDTFGPAPGHVGINIGGRVVHALNESRGIVISDIGANMGGPYMGARRILPVETTPEEKPGPKHQSRPRRVRRLVREQRREDRA